MTLTVSGHIVRIDAVLSSLRGSSRKQIYQSLAGEASSDTGLPAALLFDRMMDRERQAPSGIGEGVAIPHMRLAGIETPYCVLATLAEPVDFAAVDDRPVDLLCLLLSPESDGPRHLRRLSRLTRLLRDQYFCQNLRAAGDHRALRALISGSESRMLAA